MRKWRKQEIRRQAQVGGVFRVPLTPELHVWAQYLPDRTFAFFDLLTAETTLDCVRLASLPVLFRLAVVNEVFEDPEQQWPRLGYCAIAATLQEPAVFGQMIPNLESAADGDWFHYKITNLPDRQAVPISQQECGSLEMWQVWYPAAVIVRLQQHYQLPYAGQDRVPPPGNHIDLSTLGREWAAALPDFAAFSKDFREYLADPAEGSIYLAFMDYGMMLNRLMDAADKPALTRYFHFLNELLESADERIEGLVYECVIESLALISEFYYTESLKYLSPVGMQLVNWCKANPPLGVKSPPW